MSVLIKGMKMPKFCAVCCIADWEYDCCPVADRKNIRITDTSGRPDFCPLVELPDHGDLIDREYAIASACSGRIRALPTTEDGEDWIRVEEVRQSIKSVPAVIPTERSEE